ncbi:discoidin domain-containing protein [Mycoplasma crocodyli]|uniref:Possible family 98 glycosyl hydrolase (Alpha-N-acetylglucosaminidase) n=1 Tax=Mycoplasma crocodyli (strain ATCC 51981 / MP145) TaxID=512564 RepID=D5E697_MYCCM|nr:discoidin domain-containing protein [Mycoplasma crocodyli]ADE19548.1 possible family 98 glycosyl hydrolase (alpha-N-acetylglucosaminidase) [Mycoplasma crocodyli MP145]
MKKITKILLGSTILVSVAVSTPLLFISNNQKSKKLIDKPNYYNESSTTLRANTNFNWLSDLTLKNKDSLGNEVKINTNYDGKTINLNIGGKKTAFFKGLGTHSDNELIYDLSDKSFDKFSAYYGVDFSKGDKSAGVKFNFFVSDNGTDWTSLKEDASVYKGNSEAGKIDLDITGKKVLKITIKKVGGSNSYNHAVLAHAMFRKSSYPFELKTTYDFIKTPEEYKQSIIAKNPISSEVSTYELDLYKEKFVSRVGYDYLVSLFNVDEELKTFIQWLFNDSLGNKLLKYYMTGGDLDANKTSQEYWVNSIKVLHSLYKKYLNSFNITFVDETSKVARGEVYLKLAAATALVYGTGVWSDFSQKRSDPLTRFEIFYKLRSQTDQQDITEYIEELEKKGTATTQWEKAALLRLRNRVKAGTYYDKLKVDHFDNLTVEHMRWIINSDLTDDEINFLNYWSRRRGMSGGGNPQPFSGNFSIGGYDFVSYTTGSAHSDFFKKFKLNEPTSPEAIKKFEEMDKKYFLTKFGIKNDGVFRNWVRMEVGQVCGGISKQGTAMLSSTGYPSVVVGQPGHGAYLNYKYKKDIDPVTKTEKLYKYWAIDNQVGSWNVAEKGERMILDWRPKRINGDYFEYNVNYIQMAENALKNKDQFYKSNNLFETARFYDDIAKKEEIYRKAIEIFPQNYNAIYALDLLMIDPTNSKSDADKVAFGKMVLTNLKMYPHPYNNIVKQVVNSLKGDEHKFELNSLLKKNLVRDSRIDKSEAYDHGIINEQARGILGDLNTDLATFSFSGDKANKIVINDMYKNSDTELRYSIDGGSTFKTSREKEVLLSDEEITLLTDSNDIVVGLSGTSETFRINLSSLPLDSNKYYYNNLTQKLYGDGVDKLLWSEDKKTWTSFKEQAPKITEEQGKEIFIKRLAFDKVLPAGPISFTFYPTKLEKEDAYLPTYLFKFTASDGGKNKEASKAVDEDFNSYYETGEQKDPSKMFMQWEFNKPIKVSKIEYLPKGGNGNIQAGKVLYSTTNDDEASFTELTTFVWKNDNKTKIVDFILDKEIKYLKIIPSQVHGGKFLSAREINLYGPVSDYYLVDNSKYEVTTNSEEKTKENNALTNALDNDFTNIWHSNWNKNPKDVNILFTFNKPLTLSSLVYEPRKDVMSGIITKLKVSYSLDGVEYKDYKTIDLKSDSNSKEIIFDEPIEAKYLKLDVLASSDGHSAAQKFRIYEKNKNISIDPIPELPQNPTPNEPNVPNVPIEPKPTEPTNIPTVDTYKGQKETNSNKIILFSSLFGGLALIGVIGLATFLIMKKIKTKKN